LCALSLLPVLSSIGRQQTPSQKISVRISTHILKASAFLFFQIPFQIRTAIRRRLAAPEVWWFL